MNLGWEIGEAARRRLEEEERRRIEEEERRRRAGFWHEVGRDSVEWVRTVVERYDPIRFEMWDTMEDERTCPICGLLEGEVWREGEGFTPPVHDFCRCQRVYHHTEFAVRYIEVWEQRTTTTYEWEWQRTYW